MTAVEQLVENAKAVGVTVCADIDEDCPKVKDHYRCWTHEEGTGFCPYAAGEKVDMDNWRDMLRLESY